MEQELKNKLATKYDAVQKVTHSSRTSKSKQMAVVSKLVKRLNKHPCVRTIRLKSENETMSSMTMRKNNIYSF